MLRGLTWRQFEEWMEKDRLDPIGQKRGDWQAATICATFMNIHASEHAVKTRFSPSDFMLEFGPRVDKEEVPKGQSWQEMRMIGQMMATQSKPKKKWKK
jgi:hypothetical protein